MQSSTATEHVAASAEITMDMQAVVTEWSQLSTDDARELVHAAQILSTGNDTCAWTPNRKILNS